MTLLFLALAWGPEASAYEVTTCDNCSGSGYSQAAVYAGCPNEDDVYVVNRPVSVVKAYETICNYDPGQTIEEAYKISGNPTILADIDEVLDFHHWLKNLSQKESGTPPDKPAGVDAAVDLHCDMARCDHCAPEERARSAMAVLQDDTECVLVVDRRSGEVLSYDVGRELNEQFASITIEESQPDDAVVSSIEKALTVWSPLTRLSHVKQLPGLEPKADFDSALDLVGQPDRQQKVGEAIGMYATSQSEAAIDATVLSRLLGLRVRPEDPERLGTAVRLAHEDGSSSLYSLVNVDQDGESVNLGFEYRYAGSVDADGQPIPRGAPQLVVRGKVTGENATEYKKYADRLGIPVDLQCGSELEKFRCEEGADAEQTISCIYQADSQC